MSIRKGLFFSFSRTGLSFLISFVSNVVLARLLLPSEIGVFSVVVAGMAILHAIRDFGIGRYLIKERDLTENKIGTVFAVSLAIGWGLAALILLARGEVAVFYGEPLVEDLMQVTALSFMILPFGQPALSLLRRERRYGRVSLIMVLSTASGACTSILFAWLGFGAMSLAYGSLVNVILTSALALWSKPDHVLLKPRLSEWRSVVGFGGMASLSTMVGTLGMQAPELIMGRVLGFTAVGLYSKGLGLAFAFERMIVVAVSFVTGAEFAALHRGGEKLDELTLKVTDYILVVGWPFLIFLAINAETVILLLFGENWLPASPVLQALCVARGISLLVSQAPALYEGSGAVALQFRNECILQTSSVILLVAGLPFGIVGVAWLRPLLACMSVACHLSVYRRHARIGFKRLLSSNRTALQVAMIFAAALALYNVLVPLGYFGAFGRLAAEGVFAAVLYLFLVRVVRHPIYRSLSAVGERAIQMVRAR